MQKVVEAVESVWGAKFVQFLAELAVLPLSIWKEQLNPAGLFGKKRLNSTCFFTTTETKQLARQGIYQIEQTDTTRPLPCLLFQSFFYGKTLFLHLAFSPQVYRIIKQTTPCSLAKQDLEWIQFGGIPDLLVVQAKKCIDAQISYVILSFIYCTKSVHILQ